MGIGLDIKETLAEVGNSFTILKDSGTVSGEYFDFESNSQVTKPFIREYFLEATFQYDTAVVGGDVVDVSALDEKYLVMNKTPITFENEAIEYQVVLYKCNVSGELKRPSDAVFDGDYRRVPSFSTQRSNAYAVLVSKEFGTDMEEDEEIGPVEVRNMRLYIPHRFGAQPHDRYIAASGEYYKIETIMPRRYDSVDLCRVSVDTR